MDTITYTITSFILNFVPERAKSYPKLVAFGTIFFVISMIFSGPVPNIFPNDVDSVAYHAQTSGKIVRYMSLLLSCP